MNTGQLSQVEDWKKVLSKAAPEVKQYWLELIDDDWDFFEKYCGIKLTPSDLPSMKLTPIPVNRIDSVSEFNFEGQLESGSMKLDRTKGTFFASKGSQLVVSISAKYEDGKWSNGGGYGPILPGIGEKVVKLISEGKVVYELEVYAFPRTKQPFYTFMVYESNGQPISLRGATQETPLKQELQELTLRAKQADIEWKKYNKP